ncbi:hypothetical protein [Ornithinicoccus hortensis]|uniref:Uncharacterized protein n=1 Tax=Ornithinicoccus hortensis TaxID=82346 RepID=A0A542YRC2_9MICO|nr:hypothetical protein [Ornithinicoccus hortensis]TQL50597.1 hypothetical protein FB467_1710 [Ornithinicoccus hortensis]
MAWWNRKRKERQAGGGSFSGGPAPRTDGPQMSIDLGAVRGRAQEFVESRRGVEGYVEPATNVSTTTLILIAHDGEWTRRAVGSPKAGFQLCRDLGIPVYDVNQTGYPSRMREWNRRHKGNGARP